MNADVLVIGSGAAGGWAAKELAQSGLDVIVLEAGRDPHAQERVADDYYRVLPSSGGFYDAPLAQRQQIQKSHPAWTERSHHFFVDDVAHPYSHPEQTPFVWIRGRQVGGKTLVWGGQTWRLSDFELSSVVPPGIVLPRWPLRYAELEPFYDEVERSIGVVGAAERYAQLPGSLNPLPPGALTLAEERLMGVARALALPVVRTRSVALARSTGSDWPSFSSQKMCLEDATKTGRCRVVPDAVVERVLVDESQSRVTGVTFIDTKSQKRQTLSARAVVMAASALESVRILLNSAPGGIGNRSQVLGRFIVDHPGLAIACRLPPALSQPSEASFWNGDGVYIPRFTNLEQQDQPFYGGFGISAWLARRETAYFLRNALPSPEGAGFPEGELGAILALGEAVPRQESTLTLEAERRDVFGIPIPHIHVVYGRSEEALLDFAGRTVSKLVSDLGGQVLQEVRFPAGALIHEVGGARMGADPATSYLNSRCQSWALPNLYVVDGACWPTAAYQNPTLTIMALALRAARGLAQDLKR